MNDHDLLGLPCERGVKQLTCKHQRRAGENQEDDAKLAALRLVNSKGVCQFDARLCILIEIGRIKLEDRTRLRREFDLEIRGLPVLFLRAAVADYRPYLTVRQISRSVWFWIDFMAVDRRISVVDHLIAVDDLFIAHGFRDRAIAPRISRLFDLASLVSAVDQTVQRLYTPCSLPNGTQYLPVFGGLACPAVVAPRIVIPNLTSIAHNATE